MDSREEVRRHVQRFFPIASVTVTAVVGFQLVAAYFPPYSGGAAAGFHARLAFLAFLLSPSLALEILLAVALLTAAVWAGEPGTSVRLRPVLVFEGLVAAALTVSAIAGLLAYTTQSQGFPPGHQVWYLAQLTATALISAVVARWTIRLIYGPTDS
ncbi:MAG: hypothetical protein QOG53_55 [Frankiales bacterium]|jgi:hypothetical protein|nr:hypothetical protein [Frankiales bacterium]